MDFSLLAVPGGDGVMCWRLPDRNWKQYDKLLIERMRVTLKSDSESKGIDPSDLKMLLDYFHDALVRSLSSQMQIVTKPGAGVIRMRIALTNLVPTSVSESLVSTAIPYGFVAEAGAGTAAGRPAGSTPYMGETGIEVHFRDGASAQVLGECADTEIGRNYAADLNKGASGTAQIWINGYLDSFTSWSYARDTFDKWAALTARRFADLRGVQAP